MISRVLKYLISRYNLHIYVRDLLNENHVERCKRSVKGVDAVFYPEANVDNLMNDSDAIVVGKNTHIRGELLVWKHGGKIQIGENSFIGQNSKIWSGDPQGIKIGNNVLISHNVTVIDSDSHELDAVLRAENFVKLTKEGHPEQNNTVKTAPITIGDFAWISYNVCILKGVAIGEGAIVGAGSVVTRDIPSYTMATGNPAVVKKNLKDD